jgi:glycosyltransferase involved in cell wall biosynthesis
VVRTVALYTDSQGFGGAEVQLLSLAERLDRRRFQPLVMHAPSPVMSPSLADGLRKLDIESQPVPSPLGARHVDGVLRFASILRKRRVDVFHAHKTYPPACRFGLLAAVLARCEVVISTDQLRPPSLPPRRQRYLLRLLSACMDAHIAVSTSMKQYLVELLKFRADKVRVIANWVDPDVFAGASDPTDVRMELAIPANAMVIGCVARFHEQKGHLHLVTAAADLVRRHPQLHFILIGDGVTREDIEAHVRMLNLGPHFHFLGQRDDVPALLTAIDIFALPSEYEGLPVSVLEAMSSGKPVVATAVDGTLEAIADPETGILVPPGDVAALTAALDLMIGRPEVRAAMGAAGRRRVLQNFAAEPLVRQTEALYQGGDR